jgi:putative glutamine amidotransferase
MARPRIGYTTQNYSFDALKWLIALSIWVTGGTPVRLTPNNPRYDEQIDGLVIGGGIDLYPALYNLDPKPNYKYDQARDELEINWLRHAEEQDIPVLGICRGAQLMNVVRGGTLHVDVAKVYENAKYPSSTLSRIFFRKDMNIECGSLLERILKTQRIAVNSMHVQAVDEVGKDLVISAREDNGVVQAVEDPDKAFFLGVQFHPEALIHNKIFRGCFAALRQAAQKKAAQENAEA